ncbi:TolB family protein [Nocardioides pelophilus]|uniref:TolB family protein n=1 Tax=Nocardioides pelophilus TaxID=2172019 RepID=UPI0015FEC72A|nr:PD40 domain-containing protein [Nocardioides pelophilus]
MSLRARLLSMTAAAVLMLSLGAAVGPSPSIAAEGEEATGDGLLLYADSTWTGTYSLISADGSTWQRGVRDLFRGGQVIDADFSPDGGSIAFLRTCATCEPSGWNQPSALRILASGDRRDRLVWQGVSLTDSSRMTYADALAWSPDGSEIATFEGPGIVAIDVATGAERTVLESGDVVINTYAGLSWSADDEIAFVGSSPGCTNELCSRNDLYAVDAGAGSAPQLFGGYPGDDDPDDVCAPQARWSQPAWSPDGQTMAAYLRVERGDCPADPGARLCSLQLVRADRAESLPTTLRTLAGERDCFGDESSVFFSDLMEPRWSDDGTRVLTAWNAYLHYGFAVAYLVDPLGPDLDVATLGDLDPATLYEQLPLPFDWQPCPGGTCAAWEEPVHADRVAQTAVACGRTAFRWTGPRGDALVAKGDRTCTFVLSNNVAHDLLRLAAAADSGDPLDPGDVVEAQLASHAEDWVIDRLAARMASTSPRWLRRAIGVDVSDSRQWYLPGVSRLRLDENNGCIQFDVRITGENEVVRERVLKSGTPARTWRTQRVNGRRTTVPVRLGLVCNERGGAESKRPSSAWTPASQDRTLFRARWNG